MRREKRWTVLILAMLLCLEPVAVRALTPVQTVFAEEMTAESLGFDEEIVKEEPVFDEEMAAVDAGLNDETAAEEAESDEVILAETTDEDAGSGEENAEEELPEEADTAWDADIVDAVADEEALISEEGSPLVEEAVEEPKEIIAEAGDVAEDWATPVGEDDLLTVTFDFNGAVWDLTEEEDVDESKRQKYSSVTGYIKAGQDVWSAWKNVLEELCRIRRDQGGGYYDVEFEEIYQYLTWDEDDPTRCFCDWSTDASAVAGKDIEDDIIYDSVTYYVIWVKGYHVYFDANGGYFGTDEEQTLLDAYVAPGKRLYWLQPSVLDLVKRVHRPNQKMRLDGWRENPDDEAVSVENLRANEDGVVYHAVWYETARVTFHATEGTLFKEWDEESDEYTVYSMTIAVGRTLGDKSDHFMRDDFLNVPEDKYLAGWSFEEGGDVLPSSYIITVDMDLYAVWKDGVTITFDAAPIGLFDLDDFTEDGEYVQKYVQQSTLCVPAGTNVLRSSTRIDSTYERIWQPYDPNGQYVCCGWSEKSDGGMNDVLDKYIANEPATLYAVWRKSCKVVFDGNGGRVPDETGGVVLQKYLYEGDSLEDYRFMQAVSDDKHKVFDYWSTDQEGKARVDLGSFTLSDSVQFYANWKEYWHITLNANGGWFSVNTETVFNAVAEKGKQLIYLPSDIPTSNYSGKEFSTWAYDREGKKVLGSSLGSFVPTGDTTLYAIYKDKPQPQPQPKTETKTSINNASVSNLGDSTYTGKAIRISPVVSLNGKILKEGTDYEVAYKNNVEIGTAAVTITGMGSYVGQLTAAFKIVPVKASVSSIRGGRRSITIKFKEKNSPYDGYQVQVSKDRKFKKKTKTTTIKSGKKTNKKTSKKTSKKTTSSSARKTATTTKVTSKTIKGLKKGRSYVRVRTYKNIGGKKYFSKWSKTKKVLVK